MDRTVALESPAIVAPEPLMTAAQVAALLAVPRSSVYEYARRSSNPIPSVLIGRHRRFVRAEVLAWVRSLSPA